MLINIPYGRKASVETDAAAPSNSELTEMYLNIGFQSVYPDGLGGQKGRTYGRIQRKIENAIINNEDNVELNVDEKEIIYEAIIKKEAKFPPAAAKFTNLLLDEIDKFREEIKSPNRATKKEDAPEQVAPITQNQEAPQEAAPLVEAEPIRL